MRRPWRSCSRASPTAHADARADHRDGLRLDWPDAWVHIRASNTEPIVRVIAEARDRRRAEELAESLGALGTGFVKDVVEHHLDPSRPSPVGGAARP